MLGVLHGLGSSNLPILGQDRWFRSYRRDALPDQIPISIHPDHASDPGKKRWKVENTDKRVDLPMTPRIMPLDVFELGRAPKRIHIPIQRPHPPMQRRIARPYVADVALEMLHVHGVEADDGRV